VLFILILASTSALFASKVVYSVWLDRTRTETMYARLVETKNTLDTENLVPRPDVKAELEKIIFSRASSYLIILGNQGCGKTSIVKQIASQKPGVLYISIRGADDEDLQATLYQAFEHALLGDYPTSLMGTWLKDITHGTSKENSTASDYRDLLVEFEKLAARFQAEHGRPAVLIFDDVDPIARDPELLRRLQRGAKEVADQRSYKVVFVCSDGVAPAQFRRMLSS
jgi:Cdc6-like AAA superfamily ATPase